MARLLFFLLCVNLFAQPAGRGVISGTVIDVSSGDPVRKAIVTVTWHGTPRSWATIRTDGSGRFVFDRLPAGAYDLRATKQGVGTAIYGANSVRELGDLITLGEGENHGNIKLRFLRSATISGRVLDADGEPVAGVAVNVMRSGRNLGERVLLNYQAGNTDDRGEYKIGNIDPGEYYVHSNPINVRMGPGGPINEMVVPQYYGGARNSKEATALTIRGGEVLSGFDFHLTREQPAKITGRVTGVPPLDESAGDPRAEILSGGGRIFRGRGGPGVGVNLTPAGEDASFGWNSGANAQGPDYRFEMQDVLPGRYRIEATVRKDKTYYAIETVDVHAGTNDLVLTMVPGVDVKGHLKVEGSAPHPVESFRVMLAAVGSGPRMGNFSSAVKKDGSFSIEDVPPGEWLLNINPTPNGIFEKSVRLGDKDFLYKKLEIPASLDAPLNLVLSSSTGTVSGEVDGAAQRVGILLAPVGERHTLARFYYSATAEDNGKFKLNAVAPGKYKIYALEKIATASYRTPEAADVLDALGEDLEVTEGAKVESHPKLIPEEKAREILKP